MSKKFASGKYALGICDRCGRTNKLKELKEEIVKDKKTGVLVCKVCLNPDHPQLKLGLYPVNDPQGLKNPRPEVYDGNRSIQWGWAPVGFGDAYGLNTENSSLTGLVTLGTITVTAN